MLPDAHVEAPTKWFSYFSRCLLKMGGYGFIRFSLTPCFLRHPAFQIPLLMILSIVAIIYTSLVALAQEDMFPKLNSLFTLSQHMG